jgi:Fic family protein
MILQRIKDKIKCHKNGHVWGYDSETLGGVWIKCSRCFKLDEFLPGVHEPEGAALFMPPTTRSVLYMITESNAIEEEYDEQSIRDAYAAWEFLMNHDKLTNEIVKRAHGLLMKNKSIDPKGDYRNSPVTINGQTKTLPRIVIESLMRDLLDDMNSGTHKEDYIMHHVQFEAIHPFIDGNGRMGRLLLNWEAVKRFNGALTIYTEKDKEKYYQLFR